MSFPPRIPAPINAFVFWVTAVASYLGTASTQPPGKLHEMQNWPCYSPTLRPSCFLLSLQNKMQNVSAYKAFHVWPSLILTAYHILLPGKTTLVLISQTPQGLLYHDLECCLRFQSPFHIYLPIFLMTELSRLRSETISSTISLNTVLKSFLAHIYLFIHITLTVYLGTQELHLKCG